MADRHPSPVPSRRRAAARGGLMALTAALACASCGGSTPDTGSPTATSPGSVAPAGTGTGTTPGTAEPGSSTTVAVTTNSATPAVPGGPTTAAPAPPTTQASPASPTTGTPAPAGLVLEPNGVGAVSFGAPAAVTITALTARLGPMTGDEAMTECGDGVDRSVSWRNFSATFTGEQFVGYHYSTPPPGSPRTPPLATAKGIGLTSTVGNVKTAYPGVVVHESTLGPEWGLDLPTGFLGGFATNVADAGTVNGVFAGMPCFFR